jgi:succinate dehydrogenase hydrophobic anchor subunit
MSLLSSKFPQVKKAALVAASYALPVIALAQTGENITLNTLLDRTATLLNRVIVVLIVIATIIFMWGAIKLVTREEPKEREAAKKLLVWAIVGLILIVSVWAIVGAIVRFYGVEGTDIPGIDKLPRVPDLNPN